MPYQPGVTDQRGQIWGQAIQGLGQDIAGGIQQYQTNKIMAGQAIADWEGTVKADPGVLTFLQSSNAPSEAQKAWQKLQKDGSLSVRDASVLSTFGRSYASAQREQQARALQGAQMQQAQAQASDLASQAKQRDLQNNLLQRQQDMLEQIFNSKNPDAPISADTPSPGVVPFHAPASASPTRRGILMDIARGTGQIPDAKTVDGSYQQAVDNWAKVERPLGYVAGGQEKDKEGKDVQNYYPVTIRNDGTILQQKEPVKVYTGIAPPGALLDGKTFQPTATPQGQSPQKINLSNDAKKELVDTADDIRKLSLGLTVLSKLEALNSEMTQKRSAAMSGVTGTGVYNNVIGPMAGDDTGQRFDANASSLKADVMSNMKNIRNVYEFKSVTGNVPTSQQTPRTRTEQLANLREALENAMTRNQRAIELLQQGAEPDSAWVAATPNAEKVKVGEATPMPAAPSASAASILQKYGIK